MKIDNLEFVDFPQQVSVEEYERNEREFVKYFQNHPAVASIYKLGSISDPGISDLDLILVLKDKQAFKTRDYKFLDKLNDYVFIHGPFVITETLFPYVNYLFYTSNLCQLTGTDYIFVHPESNAERHQLAWLTCAEASLSRLCDIVYQVTQRKGISTRRMLLKLNSIKHDIDLLEDVCNSAVNNRLHVFACQISELRKSWFSLDRKEQVSNVLKALNEAIKVLSEIMDSLACISRKVFDLPAEDHVQAYTLFPDSLQVLKFEPRKKTSVETNANPLSFLRKCNRKYKRKITRHTNDISVITLPIELLFLLSASPELSNAASNIRDNLTLYGENKDLQWSQVNNSDLMLKRCYLVDIYNDYLDNNNFSSMSLLLMAPWLATRKAKFHDFKKLILKLALKMRII